MNTYCPCCNAKGKGFRSGWTDHELVVKYDIIGMGRRYNRNCNLCNCNDRERLVTLYLKEYVLSKDFEKIKILHIAPENMLASILEKDKRIDYVKGDKFREEFDEWYNYPNTIEMDIRSIPFDEGTFDFVICNHVLEHIEDDILAMNEIYRVLKKDGQAILQVPIADKLEKTYEDKSIQTKEMRTHHFAQKNHVRIYARDYTERLKSTGFAVEVFSFTEKYGNDFSEEQWLNPKEKIILCKK